MIRIPRPEVGPPSLLEAGKSQTQLDCEAYDACPSDYLSGKLRFPKRDYHSEKEVKDLLVEMHHGKCCYCERKFWETDDLEVEHYRPKGGVRQSLDQKHDELPGYYWLAYAWENLLLSCRTCNQRFKKTFFPLENPAERARSHRADVTKERPQLVDPAREDPRAHIHFLDDTPYGRTERGRVTIEGLGLTRARLKGERRDRLDKIRKLYDVLKLATEDRNFSLAEEMRAEIWASTQAGAKFSSMVIDFVERHPLWSEEGTHQAVG